VRIGTRASTLALAQAQRVAGRLEGAELVPMTTTGDRAGDRAGTESDKSRWVAELEEALLAGEIDIAVHSAKDVPGELPEGLAIVGVPERADARDALCGAASLEDLAPGARVGTSSLRRRAQLRALRDDLDVVDLRGNVDTRLRKLAEGECDAIVVALAGLERLGRVREAGAALDAAVVVPAPGQGTLAIEGRAEDHAVRAAVAPLTDRLALTCLLAERAVVSELDATCHTPVGAHAQTTPTGELELHAFAGLPDGSEWVRDVLTGAAEDPAALGREVAARLLAAGAGELLARAEALARAS
jgi:hydroxymethylbilane synthase